MIFTRPDPRLKLLMQHMQNQPANVQDWSLPDRLFLLTGGTIGISLNGTLLATVPKFAAIAVSTTFQNLVFNERWKARGEVNMDLTLKNLSPERKTIHEASLKAFALWLNSLCTEDPTTLAASDHFAEVELRVHLHVLGMDLYATHLIDKFVHDTMNPVLTMEKTKYIVNSVGGPDDPLLKKLGVALVERIFTFKGSLGSRVWLKMFDETGTVAKEMHRVLRADWGKVLIAADEKAGRYNDFLVDAKVHDQAVKQFQERSEQRIREYLRYWCEVTGGLSRVDPDGRLVPGRHGEEGQDSKMT
ncbi:hypothetical protein K458DRAFT_429961 [Lentithecium fluviatile CBS 122367]|uniref:Uncharacterized protein n=1 Tax=Lentithecium fluviatile CBS 122367 TaxID=1168545 RepID=A0A6G1J660_9PLEO|nr:hypothetical protein K458DRAFT_429961 [Lentithecium fluviatile CBS 122367]